jgi:hypothetical protein
VDDAQQSYRILTYLIGVFAAYLILMIVFLLPGLNGGPASGRGVGSWVGLAILIWAASPYAGLATLARRTTMLGYLVLFTTAIFGVAGTAIYFANYAVAGIAINYDLVMILPAVQWLLVGGLAFLMSRRPF